MHRIEFFYDIISPYSWLAFETLCRYRPRWDLDLGFRPFLLGGVMKATGNRPPAALPARGQFLALDLARNRDYFGVPLQMPRHFPMLTLQTMRLLTAVREEVPERLEAASRRLWQQYWSEGGNIGELETLLGALRDVGCGESEAAALIARTADPAVKEALKATTQVAIDRGAFGAPTYFVMGDGAPEMFFGSDRFPHLAARLGETWVGPQPEVASAG